MNTRPDVTLWQLTVCQLATAKHKLWVMYYILKACWTLIKRGIVHDWSKFTAAEAPYFAEQLHLLKGLVYGSPEYKAALEKLGPALAHHYAHNRHHPEYYSGRQYMSPLDQLEMLCDWKAATRRHATGDIRKSIDGNAGRFHYSDDVLWGYHRDVGEIGMAPPLPPPGGAA